MSEQVVSPVDQEDQRDQLDQLGPIDYLVIEFPGGRLTGEGLPMLVDLVDRRIIRVFDLLFVKKSADGTIRSVDIGELDADGSRGLVVFNGASSGLLGRDDVEEAAAALEPGSAAAIIVYENLWAAPLAVALRKGGAQLVAAGRIPVQALLAALEHAEGASADAPTVREG
jgi:Family of unknown function (DUF6325)